MIQTMIDYPPLRPYREHYAEIATEPLRIVIRLRPNSHIACYDPLNLDNLLARAVVDEATLGAGLPNTPEAYDLPVPLKCLWRSEDGYPLWAATPFRPVGDVVSDVAYWHKRAQPGSWTGTRTGTFGITSTAGRWMERRVPMPTQLCALWEATAIGNPEAIAQLLAAFGWVGKRRTKGFGEVLDWRIEPLSAFALEREGLLTRPMPAEAVGLLGATPEDEPAPVGWTPPQWKPSLFRPGWWTGTPVK